MQMTEDTTESAALTVVPLTQSALEVHGVANGSLVPMAKFEEVRPHGGGRPGRMQWTHLLCTCRVGHRRAPCPQPHANRTHSGRSCVQTSDGDTQLRDQSVSIGLALGEAE